MEINTLNDMNVIADQRVEELFQRAEDQRKREEEEKNKLIENRKQSLIKSIMTGLPPVVEDYLSIKTRPEEDFIDASERGIVVVVSLPEAYPIHKDAYYDVWLNDWRLAEPWAIRHPSGLFLGKSNDFLTAVGGARRHFKHGLDTNTQQVVH